MSDGDKDPRWSEGQKTYYDQSAEEYGESFQQGNPYFEFVNSRYLSAIDPGPSQKVLEYGTSGGRFTIPLLERGCRVTGVDISPSALSYFEESVAQHPRRRDLRLVVDDVCSLAKLEETGFDAVVGAHILHHVPDMEGAVSRAFDRLRPRGKAVFLEPNPWNPLWYAQFTFDPTRSWRVEKGFLRVWPSQVSRALSAAGFEDVRTSCFGFFPPLILNNVPAARRWESFLERLPFVSRFFTLNLFEARRP